MRRDGPLRTVEDLELVTASWVHRFNTSRLRGELGLVPPVEYETSHHDTPLVRQPAGA